MLDRSRIDYTIGYPWLVSYKDEEQARRYLSHVGLDHIPPARAQPRGSVQIVDFDQTSGDFVEEPVIYID